MAEQNDDLSSNDKKTGNDDNHDMLTQQQVSALQAQLLELAKQDDVDHTGLISYSEFVSKVKTFMPNVPEEKIRQIFDEIESDQFFAHDGKISYIEAISDANFHKGLQKTGFLPITNNKQSQCNNNTNNKTLQQQLNEMTEKYNSIQQKARNLELENKEYVKELVIISKKDNELISVIQDLHHEKTETETQNALLLGNAKMFRQESDTNQELENILKKNMKRINNLIAEKQNIMKTNSKYESQLHNLNEKLSCLEQDYKHKSKQFKEKSVENEYLRTEIEGLQTSLDNYYKMSMSLGRNDYVHMGSEQLQSPGSPPPKPLLAYDKTINIQRFLSHSLLGDIDESRPSTDMSNDEMIEVESPEFETNTNENEILLLSLNEEIEDLKIKLKTLTDYKAHNIELINEKKLLFDKYNDLLQQNGEYVAIEIALNDKIKQIQKLERKNKQLKKMNQGLVNANNSTSDQSDDRCYIKNWWEFVCN